MDTSETMMKQHYHNPKTKEEGEAWFGLHPSDLIRQKSDEIEVTARTFLGALTQLTENQRNPLFCPGCGQPATGFQPVFPHSQNGSFPR